MTQRAKAVPCRTQGYVRWGTAFGLGTTILWLLPAFWAMIAFGSAASLLVFIVNMLAVLAFARRASHFLVGSPPQMVVGDDGLLFVDRRARSHWVPYSRIQDWTVQRKRYSKQTVVDLALHLDEGTWLPEVRFNPKDGDFVIGRIQAAVRRPERQVSMPRELRNDEESHAACFRRLRAGEAIATPRSSTISASVLCEVLENPTASPLDRAAAAVALGARPDHDPERLLRLAQATAHPKLRVVLEHVDDEQLAAEALAELDAEGRRTISSNNNNLQNHVSPE